MNHPHHQPFGIGELMDETMMELQQQEENRSTGRFVILSR